MQQLELDSSVLYPGIELKGFNLSRNFSVLQKKKKRFYISISKEKKALKIYI